MDIESIVKLIEKKKIAALKEFSTENNIEELITERFDNAMNKLICDVLGIRKSWSNYEVIQWCPSRRENLPTLNYIKSDLGVKKINEIVTQLFGDFKLELNEKEKTSMINEYKKIYKQTFKQRIDDLAFEQAEKDAKELMNEILGTKEGE